MKPIRFLALGALLLLGGCASLRVSDFSAGRPLLDPVTFFEGRTRSIGVFENRSGAPTRQVTTATIGHMEGPVLVLEQSLRFDQDPLQHRSWRIRRLDAHRYEATANDLIGTAVGTAYGNVFHWEFTLALAPGSLLSHVRMSQWMYLQPGGRTLINHSTIRKFGLVVAQVTEEFRRE